MSVLSNLQDLCKEDPSLEAALREAQIVTDGAGEPARISDLFDPGVDELPGLLAPAAFPAEAFCTSAVSPVFVGDGFITSDHGLLSMFSDYSTPVKLRRRLRGVVVL